MPETLKLIVSSENQGEAQSLLKWLVEDESSSRFIVDCSSQGGDDQVALGIDPGDIEMVLTGLSALGSIVSSITAWISWRKSRSSTSIHLDSYTISITPNKPEGQSDRDASGDSIG